MAVTARCHLPSLRPFPPWQSVLAAVYLPSDHSHHGCHCSLLFTFPQTIPTMDVTAHCHLPSFRPFPPLAVIYLPSDHSHHGVRARCHFLPLSHSVFSCHFAMFTWHTNSTCLQESMRSVSVPNPTVHSLDYLFVSRVGPMTMPADVPRSLYYLQN